jgi:hypothetical protein
VTDAELGGLTVPVGVVPDGRELPGCPEAPRPDFPPHAAPFTDAVTTFVGEGFVEGGVVGGG